MSPRPRHLAGATALALVCLAALACGAHAQEERTTRTTWTTVHSDDGRDYRYEISARGEVETSDDDADVVGLDRGGSLRIEERKDGRTRRVEWTRPADHIRRVYSVNGRARALDAEGAAWVRASVLRAVRQEGMGAQRRVERIRARGGVPAVLTAVEGLRSDGARRQYYRALLSGDLRGGEVERIVAHAARTVGSDGELRLTLSDARSEADTSRERVALLDAARSIGSDGEKSVFLRQMATPETLGDAAARAAFFRAAATVGSDGELGTLLRHAVRGEPSEATVLAALRTARDIGSDGEKGVFLRAVPAGILVRARVRDEYLATLATIGSDGERDAARRHLDRSTR